MKSPAPTFFIMLESASMGVEIWYVSSSAAKTEIVSAVRASSRMVLRCAVISFSASKSLASPTMRNPLTESLRITKAERPDALPAIVAVSPTFSGMETPVS